MNYIFYDNMGGKYMTLMGAEMEDLVMPYECISSEVRRFIEPTVDYSAEISNINIRYVGVHVECAADIHTKEGDFVFDTTDKEIPLKPKYVDPEPDTSNVDMEEFLSREDKEYKPIGEDFSKFMNPPEVETSEELCVDETPVVQPEPPRRKSRMVDVRDNGTSVTESEVTPLVTPINLPTGAEEESATETLSEDAKEDSTFPNNVTVEYNPICLQLINEYSTTRVNMLTVEEQGDEYCRENGWYECDGIFLIDDVRGARRCVHSDARNLNFTIPYTEVIHYAKHK